MASSLIHLGLLVCVTVGCRPACFWVRLTLPNASRCVTISFNFDQFGDEMQPKQTTVELVIDPNALTFTSGYLSAQDGTASYAIGFAPTAVPEPAYLGLLGGTLIAMGAALGKSIFGTRH